MLIFRNYIQDMKFYAANIICSSNYVMGHVYSYKLKINLKHFLNQRSELRPVFDGIMVEHKNYLWKKNINSSWVKNKQYFNQKSFSNDKSILAHVLDIGLSNRLQPFLFIINDE